TGLSYPDLRPSIPTRHQLGGQRRISQRLSPMVFGLGRTLGIGRATHRSRHRQRPPAAFPHGALEHSRARVAIERRIAQCVKNQSQLCRGDLNCFSHATHSLSHARERFERSVESPNRVDALASHYLSLMKANVASTNPMNIITSPRDSHTEHT